MYKVFIADDEQVIREGLIQGIHWREYHCKVVGQAANGVEAVEAIQTLQPHIILTDIKMPGKNGLEVTSFAMQQDPQTKVVILTGYDHFDYTKQALQNGAFDYILKPTVYEEVQDAIVRAIEAIQNEAKRNAEMIKLRQQFKNHLELYRRAFFMKAILNPSLEEIDDALGLYEIKELPYLYVILCKVDEYESLRRRWTKEEQQLLAIALDQQISSFLDRYPYTYLVPLKEELYAIVWWHRTYLDSREITRFCEELQSLVRDHYLEMTLSFGMSRHKSSVTDLNKAYWEALDAMSHVFYLGNEAIISYDDLVNATGLGDGVTASSVPYSSYVESYKPILKALQVGDAAACQDHLTHLFESFENNQEKQETVKTICLDLGAQLISTLSNSPVVDLCHIREQMLLELMSGETLQAYYKTLDGVLADLAMQICKHTRTQHKKVVQQVMDLIEAHYAEEITLTWISEKVHMNSSYISRLIKNECGESFTDLLTRCRMEEAKKLLKNPQMRIYEVAEKVGILEPQYFASKFKKYTGISPTEYRDYFNDLF